MIVVDIQAEMKLVRALEALRSNPETSRVIHFPLSREAALPARAQERKPLLVEALQRHLKENGGQIYWTDDGDIFILTYAIMSKPARDLIVEVAQILETEPNDAFAQLYECQLHLGKVLALLETKAEQRKRQAEAERKRQQEAQLRQRREMILQAPVHQGLVASALEARQAGRPVPEILIIEDDPFSRRLVENALRQRCKLTGLESAEVALATYQQMVPDVVFLDINLPDVTGHELLQQFIRIDPNAYVVMLSGNADKPNILTAMQNGAKGFVAKPFTKEKLYQYIDRCPTVAGAKV